MLFRSGLRAVPIGLGREGRREPTVRVAKRRGGLPRLPTAIQRAGHLPETRPCFSKTIHEILAEFRWCREGAPGLEWRPGPRPAPLGRPGHIPGVPSRPKHPAQPLALDVGSPRAALVAGKGYNSSHVTRSPHPALSIRSHGRCALEIDLWLVHYARFASGAWLAPFQR